MTGNRHSQRGAVAVEFALVAILFATLLLAILSFGFWIFTLEMIADATRAGARMAVVCDINDGDIKAAIQSRVPQLSLATAAVSLQYVPAGCTRSNCQSVEVSLTGVTYTPWVPFLSYPFAIPSFATALPRESLESTNAAGDVNPVCG